MFTSCMALAMVNFPYMYMYSNTISQSCIIGQGKVLVMGFHDAGTSELGKSSKLV